MSSLCVGNTDQGRPIHVPTARSWRESVVSEPLEIHGGIGRLVRSAVEICQAFEASYHLTLTKFNGMLYRLFRQLSTQTVCLHRGKGVRVTSLASASFLEN